MIVIDQARRVSAVDRHSTLGWLYAAALCATGFSLFLTDTDWFVFTVVSCAILALLTAGCLTQAWRSYDAKRAGRGA